MGEEPEFVWGRGKSKSKRRKREPSTGCSEWLSKRKSVTTVASATCTLVQGVQTQLQPKVHSDVQLHIDDNVLLNKEELPVLSNIEGKEGLHGGVPPPIHTITEGIYVDYIPLVPILAPPPQVCGTSCHLLVVHKAYKNIRQFPTKHPFTCIHTCMG